jgi:SAM-dependent methyltransferase
MSAWFEEFFGGLYKRVLSRQFAPERTLGQAKTVRRLLGVRKGQSVLDMPCGMGRLTIPLAAMGLRMTGVDLTAGYLRTARAAARRAGVDARFVRSDMRRIDFDGEFDAAFNWFGSFGYFSERDNLDFCRRVLRGLRPGGRFLVEGLNKSWLVNNFRPSSDETVSGVRILHRHSWDARVSRIRDTWTVSSGGRTERRRLSIRIYSGPELRELLRRAGFADVRLLGFPPLGRISRHSRRVLAVATRTR